MHIEIKSITVHSNTLILLLLLKPAAQAQAWKTEIVYRLFSQPHKHMRHGKQENVTKASNQRLTAPLNPSNVPASNTLYRESYSTHEPGPAGKNLQIVTFERHNLKLWISMDELLSQLGYIELWQQQMEAYWTNNDSSLN